METITITNTNGDEYSIIVQEFDHLFYAGIAVVAENGGILKTIVHPEDNDGYETEERAFLTAVREVLY